MVVEAINNSGRPFLLHYNGIAVLLDARHKCIVPVESADKARELFRAEFSGVPADLVSFIERTYESSTIPHLQPHYYGDNCSPPHVEPPVSDAEKGAEVKEIVPVRKKGRPPKAK